MSVTAIVRATTAETDGQIWTPAQVSDGFVGTWVNTRIAQGDYCIRQSIGATNGQFVFNVSPRLLNKIGADPYAPVGGNTGTISRTNRGFLLKSFTLVHQITGGTLVSHAATLNGVTYANNIADAVAGVGGALTGALPLAIQANPYATVITLTTPVIIGSNMGLNQANIEFAWSGNAGAVLSYYGVFLNVSYNLL